MLGAAQGRGHGPVPVPASASHPTPNALRPTSYTDDLTSYTEASHPTPSASIPERFSPQWLELVLGPEQAEQVPVREVDPGGVT